MVIPKGFPKSVGKGGKPASMLSILCHFHGLPFAGLTLSERVAGFSAPAACPETSSFESAAVIAPCPLC